MVPTWSESQHHLSTSLNIKYFRDTLEVFYWKKWIDFCANVHILKRLYRKLLCFQIKKNITYFFFVLYFMAHVTLWLRCVVADPERFRYARETSFGRRHLNFWSSSPVLLWIVRFFLHFLGKMKITIGNCYWKYNNLLYNPLFFFSFSIPSGVLL